MQLINDNKAKINNYFALLNLYEELNIMIDMSIEECNGLELPNIKKDKDKFIGIYNKMLIKNLLHGEYDKNNAIITLHSGAGGTEACDWVEMLFRMYKRWCDNNSYKIDVVDLLEGEEAGIKSITFEVSGENAYGYLKSEKGVHRLVRISPFDSGGRRHTSFASCDVMPEIDDDNVLKINDEEIKIDTYRASGAGGQHINKTDSAVRITHIPTNIVVQCQNERSQHKNKDFAMKMLKAKLVEKKIKEQEEKLREIQGELSDIGWGSQIRSYVFHPYNMVKDHRTNEETGNVQSVMDGNIDKFIDAYLKWNIKSKRNK